MKNSTFESQKMDTLEFLESLEGETVHCFLTAVHAHGYTTKVCGDGFYVYKGPAMINEDGLYYVDFDEGFVCGWSVH